MIERPKLLLALTKMVRDQLTRWKIGLRRYTVTGGKIGPKRLVAEDVLITASVSLGTW
jgi:hypothetical protein